METNEEKKSWGGARTGAGRKKTRGKSYQFAATPENQAAIENLAATTPGFNRTDFINAAIAAYLTTH